MTSWITPTEAADITGVAEVTAEQIAAADGVFEIFSNVTTAASFRFARAR